MEKKAPTKQQVINRIARAIVFVDRTKDTKTMYFDDKGLRLTINEDYAVISTASHSHVFDRITSTSVSRPYLYVERFLEVAQSHEKEFMVNDTNGNPRRSYAKFMKFLESQENKEEYNVCWYIDKWFDILFAPLYAIGESEAQSFLLYESWLHNIARNVVIFGEHKEDVTNKMFIDNVIEKMREFVATIEERILFPKKTDEEVMNENIDAMMEHENKEVLLNSDNKE